MTGTSGTFDYLEHWGLERTPFSLAPDPQRLFLSRQHGECLLRLKYAVMARQGGALLVSQNAGDGKTTVLRRLCNDLRSDLKGRVRIAFIDHPTLSPVQMLQEISRQLGIAKPYRSKVRALHALRERLMELRDEGNECVVIVDEGQMLEHQIELLQELRILLNLYQRDSFLLSFILSGQLALEGVIRAMPEFWQRLPVRFFLGNLDVTDTRRLIQHRLHCAGLEADREIFTTGAYERIYAFSEGCARASCARLPTSPSWSVAAPASAAWTRLRSCRHTPTWRRVRRTAATTTTSCRASWTRTRNSPRPPRRPPSTSSRCA